MNQDVVLENSVSRYGWRFIHVMAGGKKPDVEGYAMNAPERVREAGLWGMHEWYEKGLDVWHLAMWWKSEA